MAANFRWANDGDVGAMDPATRQETVQLSFLVEHLRAAGPARPQPGLEPALAVKLGADQPDRLALPSAPEREMAGRLAVHRRRRGVLAAAASMAKNSAMRAPMSTVKEARKIDDLTVDFETNKPDPIFPQEQTNFLIMSKAWCEEHNATEPVIIGGKEDNYAVHNAMGTGPVQAGLARAGPRDRGGEEPRLVGQAGGQCSIASSST